MPNQFTASLWGDEAFSAILSMHSIPDIIKIIINDTSPPLYNITEHIWFSLFGSSEVAIRSLSFVYYLLAIFFAYKIAKLFWDNQTAIVAAVLTFLNPFFFIYAFEGRMYSILAFGVVSSMYFFLAKKWKLYVIFTLIALYSHHFAIFALFVQGLWFIYEFLFGKRKEAINMFKAFVAIGMLYVPWLIPLYHQTKMVGSGFWLGKPTLTDLRTLTYDYLGQGIRGTFAQPALWLVLLGFVVRNWKRPEKKDFFLISWFFIPILAAWGISQVFQPIFYNRYLLYAIPGAMILLASKRREKISAIVIGLTIILFAIIDFNYFTHPTKRTFSSFASVVKSDMIEGDYLVNWNASSHHLWETKYYGISGPLYIPSGGDLPFFVGTALMTPQDIIREIPKGVKRVGVVTSGSVDEVAIPGYTKSDVRQVADLKIIWFKKS